MLDSNEVVVNEDNIREEDRLNWGYIVYKKLWEKFTLDELLDTYTQDRRIKFNFKLSVFLMVVMRLLFNDSKKRGYERQGKLWGIEEKVKLNHFYRSLDILSELKEKLEDALFEKRKDLFNQNREARKYI